MPREITEVVGEGIVKRRWIPDAPKMRKTRTEIGCCSCSSTFSTKGIPSRELLREYTRAGWGYRYTDAGIRSLCPECRS